MGKVERVEVAKPLSAVGHSPPREEISQSHYITRVLAFSRFDLFDEQGEKRSAFSFLLCILNFPLWPWCLCMKH